MVVEIAVRKQKKEVHITEYYIICVIAAKFLEITSGSGMVPENNNNNHGRDFE